MKKLTCFFAIFLFCFQIALAYDFSAVSPSGHTIYYNITNTSSHTVVVTRPSSSWVGYTKPTGTLTIPSTVSYMGTTYYVTAIGDNAFMGCSGIIGITFPNSLKRIGTDAFSGCTGLSGALNLPSNLEYIGMDAFYGCDGLSGTLTIPNSVHYIGFSAFANCNNITSLSIGENVDTMSGSFASMYGLVSVQYNAIDCDTALFAFSGDTSITSFIIGNYVQSIPDMLVWVQRNLTSINFPEGLIKIGMGNFQYSNITGDIVLPSTLQEIGYGAFALCGNPSRIICNAQTPPVAVLQYSQSGIFTGHYSVPLYVPCGSIGAYQSAIGWNSFLNIYEMGCVYTIDALSNNSSMGYVQGGGTYNQGETCTLRAIPYSGFRFDHWQDGNTQNPRTITVTSDATYTAYFVETQGIDNVFPDAVNIYTLGGRIVVETELEEEIVIFDIVGHKVDGGRKNRYDVPASGVYLVKVGSLSPVKVIVVK